MRSGAAAVALLRLPNGLLAAAGVVVGARWGASHWWTVSTGLAAVSAVALTGVANAINDVEDREIDRIAHPERPLPSGALSPATAVGFAILGSVAALVASAGAVPGGRLATVSAVVILAMAGYGRLKQHAGLAANLLVAGLGSMPFVYGAWAVGAPEAAWPLVALAAPLHLARELAKDADDVAGDRGRRRTLPVVAGVKITRWLSAGAAACAVASLAALSARWPDPTTLRWVGLALLPAFIAVGVGFGQSLRTGARAGSASMAYKVAMGLAIAVLLAAPRG